MTTYIAPLINATLRDFWNSDLNVLFIRTCILDPSPLIVPSYPARQIDRSPLRLHGANEATKTCGSFLRTF
jgi:hypothetical protein